MKERGALFQWDWLLVFFLFLIILIIPLSRPDFLSLDTFISTLPFLSTKLSRVPHDFTIILGCIDISVGPR